jgi:hypothetical protein
MTPPGPATAAAPEPVALQRMTSRPALVGTRVPAGKTNQALLILDGQQAPWSLDGHHSPGGIDGGCQGLGGKGGSEKSGALGPVEGQGLGEPSADGEDTTASGRVAVEGCGNGRGHGLEIG